MIRHPVSLRGGQIFFLMVFHAIFCQILNYCFCAISSRELYVCAIIYAFSNYGVLRMVRVVRAGGHGGELCKSLNEKLVSW